MEFKKRLNNIAKRFTPQIEIMNLMTEMRDLCKRQEEILDYCEEKIATAERRREKREREEARRQQEINDREAAQDAEFDETVRDQEQNKAQKETLLVAGKENDLENRGKVEPDEAE